MFVMLCNGLWGKVIPTRLNFPRIIRINAGQRDKKFFQTMSENHPRCLTAKIFHAKSHLWPPGGGNSLALALGTFLQSEPTNPLTCFAATGSSTGHVVVNPMA